MSNDKKSEPAAPVQASGTLAMIDSAWIDGAKCGFNLGIADNRDGLHAVIAARQKDITESRVRSAPAQPEPCLDCDAAAKHSYSDATTPGFFYDKCEKHRAQSAHTTDCDEQLKALSGAHYPCTCDVERAREWLQANGYALWLTANSDSFPRCVAAYDVNLTLTRGHKKDCKGITKGGTVRRDIPCTCGYAASVTAALRAELDEVTKHLTTCKENLGIRQRDAKVHLEEISEMCQRAEKAEAENGRLQALVATCERDIGLARADYHDSQARVREWKARQAESFAFYEDEVRQLEACQAQLSQVREAVTVVRKSATQYSQYDAWLAGICDEVLSSTASSAAWLEKHDAEVAARAHHEAAEFIREWRECDCGHEQNPEKYKYNTKCGHAINCHWYIAAEIETLASRADALAGEQPAAHPEGGPQLNG
jgi:hypothetical protein